jgi:polysaccharide export outer membrane protein
MKKLLILSVLFALCITSCRSKKEVIYLQGNELYRSKNVTPEYEAIIQPDDMLSIVITSENIEAAAPFNMTGQASSSQSQAAGSGKQGYLVSKTGFIEFPVLGSIQVGGYTRSAFAEMMKEKLKPYLSDAVVTLTVLNFKITVLGEVTKPGMIEVQNDRITMLEALGKSGDMTLQGIRKNILIVRDNQGQKTFSRVDITKADFVDSPYYYLKQNDVVYVEPRRSKIDSTALGPYLASIAAVLSLVLTITLLSTRI